MTKGQSIVIRGDVSGAEDLVIAGRVEGSVTLDGRSLTLAPGSQIVGTVSAAAVIVSGNVEGRIEAGERLEIKDSATVEGDLATPKLLVAEGAALRVTVDMPMREGSRSNLAGVA